MQRGTVELFVPCSCPPTPTSHFSSPCCSLEAGRSVRRVSMTSVCECIQTAMVLLSRGPNQHVRVSMRPRTHLYSCCVLLRNFIDSIHSQTVPFPTFLLNPALILALNPNPTLKCPPLKESGNVSTVLCVLLSAFFARTLKPRED